MIPAALFKGQLGPLRSFRSPNVTTNTSSRPLRLNPPPSSYHHGLLKCQSQTACYQRPHSHPSAQPEQRRDLLHLGAIRRLHSWRIPLRENRLVLHFPIATPPKKHRRVPRLAFLWVKNNTKASADISVPDMACLNDRPVAQPKHASSLSPQNLFFLLKKPPLKAIHAEGGGGLWICFCVQLSLCSDTLQFLEFWLFF